MNDWSIIKKIIPNMTLNLTLSYMWICLISQTLELNINCLLCLAYSLLLYNSLQNVEFTKTILCVLFLRDNGMCSWKTNIINVSIAYFMMIFSFSRGT